MFRKILLILLILLIIAQFIQPTRYTGSAETSTDITHVVTVPDSVMAILKIACYDCHSDHTRYPWYSKITPVNWWLNNHVQNGKRGMNFSIYATYSYKKKAKRFDDIAETVDKHNMPLNTYLWIHKDARLNDAQRKMLIDWANASKEKVMKDSLGTGGN